jgi:hypothetical protein
MTLSPTFSMKAPKDTMTVGTGEKANAKRMMMTNATRRKARETVVRMYDCVQGIKPCECKRKEHQFQRLSF